MQDEQTATHWSEIQIIDADGFPVTGEQRVQALRAFRRDGAIHGKFFVGPSGSADWDTLPAIDWSGFDATGELAEN